MTITPEQLAEWKALAEAAKPHEWYSYAPGKRGDQTQTAVVKSITLGEYGSRTHTFLAECASATEDNKANAAFIAASRTAVPALIAEVERLRAAAELAREALDRVEKDDEWGSCLWCNVTESFDEDTRSLVILHLPDCKRQRALAALKDVTQPQ